MGQALVALTRALHDDVALGFRHVGELDPEASWRKDLSRALSPLNSTDAKSVKVLFQAQRQGFPRVLDAIKIDMEKNFPDYLCCLR